MWDLPRPGLEPVSPALAGRFSTTAPPGKPRKIFFDPPPRVMEIKTKINKWDLLHSKGNYKQEEKTTRRMGENICKQINGQRINLQNILAAYSAQY